MKNMVICQLCNKGVINSKHNKHDKCSKLYKKRINDFECVYCGIDCSNKTGPCIHCGEAIISITWDECPKCYLDIKWGESGTWCRECEKIYKGYGI